MLSVNQLGEHNIPAAHSTRVINQILANNTQNDSSSEMSLVDDELHRNQVVTFNTDAGTVDVTQRGLGAQSNFDFWTFETNSVQTEYREIPSRPNQTAPHFSQTNPFLPGYNSEVRNEGVGPNNHHFRVQQRQPHISLPNYGQSHCSQNQQAHPNYQWLQMVPASNQGLFRSNDLTKTDRTVLMELIKNVSVADGSDEIQLLNFLKELKPLFDISPADSSQIVKLLIPKTKGQLFKLWVDAATSNVSWEDLHRAILVYFLPVGRLGELEALELDRPQRPGESFVEYVDNVVAVAFALRTNRTEDEVIESVLCKCDPATKAHFAFNNKPRNIIELKMFANKVTGSLKTERRYFGPPASVTDRNMRLATGPVFSGQNPQNFLRPRVSTTDRDAPKERVVRCYKCHGEGHIARNCRSVN